MDYYKRYMGDYQRDTGHLSLAAHGAFTLLLDHYYSIRKPLPASLEDLYRLCRAMTRPEQSAVRTVAEDFFPVGQDGLRHNSRADREIDTWKQLSEEASASGKKGSAAKWGGSPDSSRTRAQRLSAARKLATHTPEEWRAMLTVCDDQCVRCGLQRQDGSGLCKDHIIPIYQGGSDGIENLQPMCNRCNSSKGADNTDHRPPGWRERLAKCLAEMPNQVPNGLPNECLTECVTLQLHSHSHIPVPNPEPGPESEADRRGQVKKMPIKPVSAAELLAPRQNGKHAGEGEKPESTEAQTLKRIVLDELGRGASAAAIIRLMPGRGLTEEQIASIARETSP
jgi:uncharacterized protein YdaU (DUF1376 family)